MVMVRVSETYDLSTQVNKTGLIGIHTPPTTVLSGLWAGFFQNYRFYRIVGCDVTLACASVLPADPLQIGEEAGDIAPQDMFNPLLFKAVSNESFNALIARMYSVGDVHMKNGANSGSISAGELPAITGYDSFDFYYGLLADADGWKKAMPQSGLSMKALYPLVYQVLNNYGPTQNESEVAGTTAIGRSPFVQDNGNISYATNGAKFLKGNAMRMPRIPTKGMSVSGATTTIENNSYPKTYVGCIVMPPAKSHKLYYRMRVTWTFEFMEPRPTSDTSFVDLAEAGGQHYGSDYAEQSRVMTEKTDIVDTKDVCIEKVMTSGK